MTHFPKPPTPAAIREHKAQAYVNDPIWTAQDLADLRDLALADAEPFWQRSLRDKCPRSSRWLAGMVYDRMTGGAA